MVTIISAIFVWILLAVSLNELRGWSRSARNRAVVAELEKHKHKIAIAKLSAELDQYKIVTELMAADISKLIATEIVKLTEGNAIRSFGRRKCRRAWGRIDEVIGENSMHSHTWIAVIGCMFLVAVAMSQETSHTTGPHHATEQDIEVQKKMVQVRIELLSLHDGLPEGATSSSNLVGRRFGRQESIQKDDSGNVV